MATKSKAVKKTKGKAYTLNAEEVILIEKFRKMKTLIEKERAMNEAEDSYDAMEDLQGFVSDALYN